MGTHDPYVVIVEFTLKPSTSKTDGRQLLVDNATTSLRIEPDCFQFDVVETEGTGAQFILYEIYRSEAAFKEHLNSPHYQSFSAKAESFFADKKIRLGALATDPIHNMETSVDG